MSDAECLLLDACQCINLDAAELLSRVASCLGIPVHIVPQVAAEAMYLHREGESAEPVGLEGIDVVELTDAELDTYVLLASRLDDGEAATIAVAAHRGWLVGTDDRAAVKAALKLGVTFRTVGTTEVVRRCVGALSLGEAEIRRLIRELESRARYVPRHDDPNLGWWALFRQESGHP